MKFTCQQRELLNALNVTIRAINSSNTLPVLNNLLIKAEGKSVVISSTNLEVAITTNIEAQVSNEGKITIPAKLLTNFVNFLKDDKVEMKVEEAVNLHISAPGTKTVIKGISADEFPVIPSIEKDILFHVDSEKLSEAVNQVVFAASLNKSRPILTGVYFEVEGDVLKIVATDSYRLSEKIIKLKDAIKSDVKCIIPASTIMELGKIISGANGDTEITISKNQVLFKHDKIELISRLIEGQFPDYKQIIPADPQTKAIINLKDFNLAIKRINLFAKENSNNVKLEFLKDSILKITTQATQFGSEEDELKVNIKGKENSIALNSEYLLDVFSNIHNENVEVFVDSELTPIQIKIPKKEDYLHIIMPLKL